MFEGVDWMDMARNLNRSNGGDFYVACDYDDILRSITAGLSGSEAVVRYDEDGYDGDTWVLIERDRGAPPAWGYLCFGWGSCSGCDALAGCRSMRELAELIEELATGIRWFETTTEAYVWFRDHDWEGDHSYRDGDFRRFVRRSRAILAAEMDS